MINFDELKINKTGLALAGLLTFGGFLILSSCGADEKADDTSTTDTKLTWATDIKPIVAANCAGSGCHETGKSPGGVVYVDQEAAFKASKSADRMALAPSNGSFMPKDTTISSADKNKLLDFLAQ